MLVVEYLISDDDEGIHHAGDKQSFEDMDKLLQKLRGALRGMTTGHGNEQQWSTLACSINVAMVLAELGVMPQGLQVIQDGQDALLRVRSHAQSNGEWRLGIHAFPIECAFRLHNQQIKEAGKGQIITAIEEVHRRVTAGQHL